MFLGERATEDLIQDKTNRLDNTPLKTLSIYCPYTVLYNVKCHKLDVTPIQAFQGPLPRGMHCEAAGMSMKMQWEGTTPGQRKQNAMKLD